MLVFASFVITGFPLSEDSLWTSSETYCKIQDTRPVLFHSIPPSSLSLSPASSTHCLAFVQKTPDTSPTHWFEDLYPPSGSLLSLSSKGKLLKNWLVTPSFGSCLLEWS